MTSWITTRRAAQLLFRRFHVHKVHGFVDGGRDVEDAVELGNLDQLLHSGLQTTKHEGAVFIAAQAVAHKHGTEAARIAVARLGEVKDNVQVAGLPNWTNSAFKSGAWSASSFSTVLVTMTTRSRCSVVNFMLNRSGQI